MIWVGDALRSLRAKLSAPVPIMPLVWFRLSFGLIMLADVWLHLSTGLFQRTFIEPTFRFRYFGFEWLPTLPDRALYALPLLIGTAALFIAAGFLYRISATVFLLGFSYVFLYDQTGYLNHYYLILLFALLLVVAPAHRAWSVDAWLRPSIRSDQVPAWSLWLLRGQLIVVYFYAAVAKMNDDWLLANEPLRTWFSFKSGIPIVGPLVVQPWFAVVASYAGLCLDLLAVPAIFLWERARPAAFAGLLGFHLMNAALFPIGIFPYLMIATLVLLPLPFGWRLPGEKTPAGTGAAPAVRALGPVATGLIVAYAAIQLLMPLRHWLYPGDVAWTREGYRFSWQMMLADIQAYAQFELSDPATGETRRPPLRDYLTPDQVKVMSMTPDMIQQFAKRLAASEEEAGRPRPEVRVIALISVNGRRQRLLIDPDVDLAAEPRNLWPARWIIASH